MAAKVKARRRPSWRTIPEFSKATGLEEPLIRRAIEKGDIKVIDFAGRKRITRAEERRILAMLAAVEAE